MQKRAVFFVLLWCFACSSLAYAGLFAEKDYNSANIQVSLEVEGEINWSTMTVRAKGSSSENIEFQLGAADFTAEEAAIADAKYSLIETLKEVPISSSYFFYDAMYIYKEIDSKVKAIASKATVVNRPVTKEDGSVEVVVEMSLTGDILDFMFPTEKNLPEGFGSVFQGKGRYTSIIFDISKLDFTPVLLPQIVDDNGKEYYNLNQKNRKAAVNSGLVRYYKSLDTARRSLFAGRFPYVIDYIGKNRYKEDSFVVPFPILDKVRNDAFYAEVLNKCKVIIVTK